MEVLKDFSLKKYNTFGLDVYAKAFCEIKNPNQIPEILQLIENQRFLFLGQGSNIVFTNEFFNGIVIKNNIPGIEILNETKTYVLIRVNSGEMWDTLVDFAVDNNLYGIENLSGIPGTVGAAPIQNIGAYGAEVSQTIEKVEFFHLQDKKNYVLKNRDCQFGYRTSIFKTELKNKGLITAVIFKLRKKGEPNLSYKGVKEKVAEFGEPTLKNIRKAILEIRSSKLPDFEKIGNAGSFFKNPVIEQKHFAQLQEKYPEIPFFRVGEERIKLPAAWLIDKAGLKGSKIGGAAVYDKQPLVIVNLGNAKPQDIVTLAEFVRQKVFEKFGINLEREVNFV